MRKYKTIIFLLILCNIHLIKCETFEECDGMPDESFVASKTSCNVYIYCMGDDSLSGECDEGQYFDSETMSCDDAEKVYCPLDDNNAEEDADNENEDADEDENVDEDEDEDIIETTSKSTTSTTTSTTTTTTISTPIDDETTTILITTTTTIETEISKNLSAPIVKDKCPETDDPNQLILLANNNSCSGYYFCYHGNAIEMHCMSNLHFNTATAQCDYPENVQCQLNGSSNIQQECQPHVIDFFPHPFKCNYFFYCVRGFLTIQQCPFYYGWDVERRACVQISQAKCFK